MHDNQLAMSQTSSRVLRRPADNITHSLSLNEHLALQQMISNYQANSFANPDSSAAHQYVASLQTEQESPSKNASLTQNSHTIEE